MREAPSEEITTEHVLRHKRITDRPVRIETTFPSTADREVAIPHTLGRPPQRWRVIAADKGATIYDGSTAHTGGKLYLKSTVGGTKVTLEVI